MARSPQLVRRLWRNCSNLAGKNWPFLGYFVESLGATVLYVDSRRLFFVHKTFRHFGNCASAHTRQFRAMTLI